MQRHQRGRGIRDLDRTRQRWQRQCGKLHSLADDEVPAGRAGCAAVEIGTPHAERCADLDCARTHGLRRLRRAEHGRTPGTENAGLLAPYDFLVRPQPIHVIEPDRDHDGHVGIDDVDGVEPAA
jgi:hypothetical protein